MIDWGFLDAYAHKYPQNSDGEGFEYPPWFLRYVHLYHLTFLPITIGCLLAVGFYSPLGFLHTSLIVGLIAFGTSVFWDMTYCRLQVGAMTPEVLRYWFRVKGWFRIGPTTKTQMHIFTALRIGMIVLAYLLL